MHYALLKSSKGPDMTFRIAVERVALTQVLDQSAPARRRLDPTAQSLAVLNAGSAQSDTARASRPKD